MTWCDEPFYGTGDMVDYGNGRTCDWRCELSSFWLKLVVNWTFTILFSDAYMYEVVVPMTETVGARAES